MSKSLKEQNNWQIWLIISVNALFLFTVVKSNVIEVSGLRAMFSDSSNLLPVGLAIIVSTVMNGLLSADSKARFVFIRWHNPLPGSRAFSVHAIKDPRIDLDTLKIIHGSEFPTEPAAQNRVWYQFYKTVEKNPAVFQVHRNFLLLRDYCGLSVLFILFFGSVGFYAINSIKTSVIYLLLLIIQYFVVRQAAANYGVRLVTTVLAQKSSEKKKVKQ